MHHVDENAAVSELPVELTAFYDTWFATVWRYMAQRGVPREGLDEAVSEVFACLRDRLARGQIIEAPGAAVCSVCYRVRRALRRSDSAVELSALEADADGSDEGDTDETSGMLLDVALASLADLEREIYLLCEGERFSLAEVAKVLGLAEIDVMRHCTRAARQVGEFFAEVRRSDAPPDVMRTQRARELLAVAQRRRTPSAADQARVLARLREELAAMDSCAITTVALDSSGPMPKRALFGLPQIVSALGELRQKSFWTPRLPGRAMLLGVTSGAIVAFSAGSYLLMTSTQAAERRPPELLLSRCATPAALARYEVAMTAIDPPSLTYLAETAAPDGFGREVEESADGQPEAEEASRDAKAAEDAPSESATASTDGPDDPVLVASASQETVDPGAQPLVEDGESESADGPSLAAAPPAELVNAAAGEPAELAVVEDTGNAEAAEVALEATEGALEATEVALEATEVAADAAEVAAETAPESTQQAVASKPVARRQAPVQSKSSLAAIERAYAAGEVSEAFDMLQADAKRHPALAVSSKRLALRARLLCSLGRRQEASEMVLDLEAASAPAGLLKSISQTCFGAD